MIEQKPSGPMEPLDMFRAGIMPCCGQPLNYLLGPRGGLSQNVKCGDCDALWSVSPFHAERMGQLTMIGEDEDGMQSTRR